jgi:3-deoxy-D-manno-octulosonate 8-phosphate phosphatase (KDO 8-P phosphatase)
MDLEQKFTEPGGIFLTPALEIGQSLEKTKAFIFDWDGVFNDGRKSNLTESDFSEIDSMGINLLRFDYWLRNNRFPQIFIITGMNNQSAVEFAKREHLDGIFIDIKNKKEAFEFICSDYRINSKEIAFIFDDVLDIEVAKMSGLSFSVGRKSNPLLTEYIIQNKICNYISSFSGKDHAVREICELIIGLSGNYTKAVDLRIQFKGEYEDYLNKRNSIKTKLLSS